MSKKITQLDATSELNNNDVFPVVNGDETKKITFATLKALLSNIFLTNESDPTVPSWAKNATKPSYKTSEIVNDSGYIDKNVNDLVNYYSKKKIDDELKEKANESDLTDLMYELFRAEGRLDTAENDIVTLQGDAGHTIEISLDNTTYILTATLKNSAGEVLNTSTVDFPVEQLVLDVQYDSTTKELIITLKNGQTRRILLSDIISGLVNQTDFDALEGRVEELQAENERLRNDLNNSTLTVEGTGENVTLENTTDARFKKFIVGGNDKQETRSGKNEFNTLKEYEKNYTYTNNGIDFTFNEDGTITLNGTAGEGDSRVNISTNTQEIVGTSKNKVIKASAGTLQGEIRWICYSSGYGNARSISVRAIDNVITQSLEDDVTYSIFRLSVPAGTVCNNVKLELQILDNSITDTTYEQYGAMPSIEFPSEIKSVKDNANIVVCNKNILDVQKNAHLETHGLTVDTDKDGIITINGTANAHTYLKLYGKDFTYLPARFNIKKKIKAGTYTLSTKNLSNIKDLNVSVLCRTEITGGITFISIQKVFNATEKKATSTFEEDLDGVIYLWIANGTTFDNDKIQIQLEQGSTATEYIANEQQEFTVPVQQEMFTDDYFDFENEKEIRKWKKYTVQGNEKTGPGGKDFATMYANGNIARTISLNDMLITDVRNDVFSNCLPTQSKTLWNGVDIGIESSVNANTVCISVPVANIEEFYGQELTVNNYATAWIQYLAHIELYFIYQLETPEKLDFTEQQITVAKQIKDTVHSYGEKTHIYSTDEVSPIFDVEACGDINKYDLNEIDNIKQAIVALGGVI